MDVSKSSVNLKVLEIESKCKLSQKTVKKNNRAKDKRIVPYLKTFKLILAT